jgi:branched-chain amino acid transport system permease protein
VGGVLNLAHGTLAATGALLAATLSNGTWTGLLVGVAAATAAGAAGGGVVAAGLAPLGGRGQLTQALATFGLAMAGTDLLSTLFGPNEHAALLPTALTGSVNLAGHPYPTYRLIVAIAAGLVLAAGWWLLARTPAGALVRAAVDDTPMLALLGVAPARVRATMLVVAGGLAGLGGGLGAPVLGAGPSTAATLLLSGLIVVTLAGFGQIAGLLAGGLLVGLAQTVGVTAAPTAAPFLLFTAMTIVLVARGQRAMEAA